MANEDARRKRAVRDPAQAYVGLFEKQQTLAKILSRHQRVDEERRRLRSLEAERAGLTKISDKELGTLRELDKASSDAQIALEAMAAGIEILAADAAVRVGTERSNLVTPALSWKRPR